MSESRVFVLAFLLAIGLCACAASDGPRETLPDYASPINNNQGWSVKCPLQTITNPLNRNFDVFRNEDGSIKSLQQFCADNDSSTRIVR